MSRDSLVLLLLAAVAAVSASAPLRVRHAVPSFSAPSVMPDLTFGTVSLDSLTKDGSWGLLVFFPGAFTFVCPTELVSFSNAHGEFQKRRVNVAFVSVDSKFSHLAWLRQSREEGGLGGLRFPLVGDVTKNVSSLFGVLIDDDSVDTGLALRGSFLIDPNRVLRHATLSDLPVGRSVEETLRLVDAFQFAHKNPGVGCPANWKQGQATIKTDPEGSREYFRRAFHGPAE